MARVIPWVDRSFWQMVGKLDNICEGNVFAIQEFHDVGYIWSLVRNIEY